MFKKSWRIILLILFLTALSTRLYSVFVPNIITHDGIAYIENAKKIASGDFKKIKEESFFNLYPILIVAFQKIFQDWELSARMVSVIFGSLGIIPIFFITQRLISLNIAILIALFYAISPHIVEYSSDILREPLFWCLFLYALWFGLQGSLSTNIYRWFFLFLSALFTGLSVSVRIEGVMIVFIILVWTVWLCKIGDLKVRFFISNSLVLVFFLIMIFLPLLFFIKEKLGWWEFGLLRDKIFYMFMDSQNIDDLIKKNAIFFDKLPNQIKGFIDISLRQRYVSYMFEVFYKLIKPLNAVFFILALFGIIRRKRFPFIKGEVFFIIWFAVAFISCYLYVAKIQYLGTRHGLLMSMPVLVWSSIGFFELTERIKNWDINLKNFSRFSTFFILFIVIAFNCYGIFTSYRKDKIELKRAGIYLKSLGFKEKKIITIPPLSRIIYYAEAKPILIQEGMSDEELEKILIENKAEYILVDKKMYEMFFYRSNRFFESPNLKKINIQMFDTLREYSLDLYQIIDNKKG